MSLFSRFFGKNRETQAPLPLTPPRRTGAPAARRDMPTSRPGDSGDTGFVYSPFLYDTGGSGHSKTVAPAVHSHGESQAGPSHASHSHSDHGSSHSDSGSSGGGDGGGGGGD